jgi:nucleoside-diphosphate kinase
MLKVSEDHAGKHYAEHHGKPFYDSLVGYLTSGPVVAMVVEGVNAIEVVRKIVGPTEPNKAPPGTIRGDYAHLSMAHADANGKPVMNLIHASDSKESAEREISLWFDKNEIVEYELPHEHLVR